MKTSVSITAIIKLVTVAAISLGAASGFAAEGRLSLYTVEGDSRSFYFFYAGDVAAELFARDSVELAAINNAPRKRQAAVPTAKPYNFAIGRCNAKGICASQISTQEAEAVLLGGRPGIERLELGDAKQAHGSVFDGRRAGENRLLRTRSYGSAPKRFFRFMKEKGKVPCTLERFTKATSKYLERETCNGLDVVTSKAIVRATGKAEYLFEFRIVPADNR